MKFLILGVSLLSAGIIEASTISRTSSNPLTPIIDSLLSSLFFPGFTSQRSAPVAPNIQNIFHSASASVDSIQPTLDDATVINAIEEPFTPSTGLDRSALNLGTAALRRSSSKLKTKIVNFVKKPFRALGWSSRDEESESVLDDFAEAIIPDFRVLNEMTNLLQEYFTTFRNTIESRLNNLNLERSSTSSRSSAVEREATGLDILYRTFRRPEEFASSLARWISRTAAIGGGAASNEFAPRSPAHQRTVFINYGEGYGSSSHRENPARQNLRNVFDSVQMSTAAPRATVRMTKEADEKEMGSVKE